MIEQIKQLRSKSVRFEYVAGRLCPIGYKFYYNFNTRLEVNELREVGIDNFFEYSENDNNNIIGYNFRMPSDTNQKNSIVNRFAQNQTRFYHELASILGDNFHNVSTCIRYDKSVFSSCIFYFYPVYKSETGKLKMTGISVSAGCYSLMKILDSKIFHLSHNYIQEFDCFSNLCIEFKGISIHLNGSKIEYNLYIKCSHKALSSFLDSINQNDIPNGSILAAIKISKKKIQGYNIYYAGEYGIPCYGWGERIS